MAILMTPGQHCPTYNSQGGQFSPFMPSLVASSYCTFLDFWDRPFQEYLISSVASQVSSIHHVTLTNLKESETTQSRSRFSLKLEFYLITPLISAQVSISSVRTELLKEQHTLGHTYVFVHKLNLEKLD